MVITCALQNTSYDILVERGCISRAGEYLNLNRRVCIVTDDGVPEEYSKTIANGCKSPIIVTIRQGEANKTLSTMELVCRRMLEAGFTRWDCVVAVGGGVVGDLAGFAASCYMRGIEFYNVPTTLLAQVDSSIGGKTAVDLDGVKNILGAFHQPSAVLIDPNVLSTLPYRHIANGLAEAVKMSVTCDAGLFRLMETASIADNMEEIIIRSLRIKRDVVQQDEKESNLRKVLNFGHTIGHGIETVGSGQWLHGECVALGMPFFCGPSVKPRLLSLLQKIGLPSQATYDKHRVMDVVRHDKKSSGGTVTVVRADEIGRFTLCEMGFEEVMNVLLGG